MLELFTRSLDPVVVRVAIQRNDGRVDTWTSRAGPPEMLILLRFLMLFKKTGHFEDATTGTPRL